MSKVKLKTPTQPSVLIAIPCMSHVPVEFMASLVTLDTTPGGRITMKSGSLVYKARNDMTLMALQGGFDYIMWLDSDQTFDTDIIRRLLDDARHGKDYVTALAFTREFPCKPIIYKDIIWEERPEGGVKCGCVPYLDYPQDSLFEIKGSGMGACLMKTDILAAVGKEFKTAPFNPLNGLGEDVSLNWRLRQMGVKMWCDSRVKVGHVGWYVFGEHCYVRPQDESRES